MTTIHAGNTLAIQYAPPFVVSDLVTTNWQLRYNATLLAFEAFDPDENVVAAGFDSIQQALFANTTNQQVFTVPWGVDTTQTNPKASLYITINGVKQHTDTYSISAGTNTTSITLGGATGLGDDVEVIGLQSTGGATVELFTGVGDNADTTFDLTWLAPSDQSLLITLDGIKQDTSAYSISANANFTATTVTFVTAPGAAVAIEIVGITTTGETPASPVDATNIFGLDTTEVFGLYASKTLTGETQILNFKSLEEGTNVTITDNTNRLTLDVTQPTFANIGSGTSLVVDPNVTTPLQLRVLKTKLDADVAQGGLTITTDAGGDGSIAIKRNYGYTKESGSPVNAQTGSRILGIQHAAAVAVNLLPIAELPAGDTITIKDESGNAATFNIIVTPSSENINNVPGTYTISTNFGYVTLYSDGTNYFIIAQG